MARRRRRRNPLPSFTDVLPTLLLLGAAWWLYRRFTQTGAGLSRGISEAWNLLTTSPVTPMNSVQLPSGEVVAVADIVSQGGGIDGQGNFTWLGVPYQIAGPHDPVTGYYVAKRIVT